MPEARSEGRVGLQRDTSYLLGITKMICILIVVAVSLVCTHLLKLIELCTLNGYSLLYVNCTSIDIIKKKFLRGRALHCLQDASHIAQQFDPRLHFAAFFPSTP